MTPSRALRVMSLLVLIRHPFMTGMAHAATGYVQQYINKCGNIEN